MLMCARASAEEGAFSPNDRGWAGTSQLREILSSSASVLDDKEIHLASLRSDDVLWLFAPDGDLPLDSIRAFVADGGTLIAFAEPSGDNELLDRYGIQCRPQQSDASWNLRDNPNWPIAIPNQHHAVTAGLRGVVVNEGCALQHTDLEPFLVYGGDNAPFAYAGGVKSGRVIMFGDASTMSNGMMRFRGNRTLAENLMRFSSRPRHVLAHPGSTWSGYYRDATELDPASRLEHLLERMAKTELPHGARAAVGLTLGLLLVFPLLLARKEVQGRVAQLDHTPRSRSWRTQKALRLRLELEDSLRRKLALNKPFSAARALREMRARKMPDANINKTKDLLDQLDRIQQHGPAMSRPTLTQLEEMVDTAEAILDRIPDR